MFERFRLGNLSRNYRLRGASTELARDKKQQRQQCVTVLFLDDITHTFRIEVSPTPLPILNKQPKLNSVNANYASFPPFLICG